MGAARYPDPGRRPRVRPWVGSPVGRGRDPARHRQPVGNVASVEPAIVVLLHPGEMGAVIGGGLREAGITVRWVSDGRSAATRERAGSVGLIEARTLDAALDGS